MLTFWQAFRKSAKEAALAFLCMIPPSTVGLVGGWLLWTHRYVALAVWIAIALVTALAVSARVYQRSMNRNAGGRGDELR